MIGHLERKDEGDWASACRSTVVKQANSSVTTSNANTQLCKTTNTNTID